MAASAHHLQSTPVIENHQIPDCGFLPNSPGFAVDFGQIKRFVRGVAQRLVPWLVPLVLIALWQFSASRGWLSNRVLPAPLDVAIAAWTLALSGDLWIHVKVSTGRALAGLAVGGGLGLVLGLLTGSSRVAETLLDSTIQMVRNIPALAMIPLVILWFGITALLVTHDVQEAVALADRVILIEDGRIALDEVINLPRPRSQGDGAFAALERRILERVLQKPGKPTRESVTHPESGEPVWPGLPFHGVRWAV